MDILLALSITLMVELLIISLFFFKDIKVFISLSLANIVLNLTMNLLIRLMSNDFAYYLFLVLFEIGTVIVEALVLIFICKKSVIKSLLISLLANSSSLSVGLLINSFNPDNKTKMILFITFAVIYTIIFAVNLSFYFLDKKGD